MLDKLTCGTCNGLEVIDALVSQHDDKKELSKCPKCNGRGVIFQMTDEEEQDYWADYW